MFVLSVKSRKIRIAAFALLLVAAVAGAILFNKASTDVADINGVVIRAANASERVAFLSQFGWEVCEDPIEVAEVMIPTEFDDTYTSYNEMQKKQKFDLTKYKGVRAKRWTYEIRNYPGYPKDAGCIRANLLVYEGKIIGGDICSVELDGFMHGFEKPVVNTTAATTVT